ncbi:unannotated protein [freshwater metagenome]|uniref:Unannotated protein n=1 Tax=freshwater metagenome TaxID=449393 RepID=A0A6J7HDG3_9ZZZZ
MFSAAFTSHTFYFKYGLLNIIFVNYNYFYLLRFGIKYFGIVWKGNEQPGYYSDKG